MTAQSQISNTNFGSGRITVAGNSNIQNSHISRREQAQMGAGRGGARGGGHGGLEGLVDGCDSEGLRVRG